jgi:sugar lactone lactonase YvrE
LQGQTAGASANITSLRQDLGTLGILEPVVVTTLAGSGNGAYGDGTGVGASFNAPNSVAVDGNGTVYVADQFNHRIRKVTSSGVVTTLAGNGTAGFADGNGTAARFNNPIGIAVDGSGNVYVADADNHRVRKITPSGVVTTLAGNGTAGFANGNGTLASFAVPLDVVVDGGGNVYVADSNNNRIRKITSAGVVTTLAGSGNATFADGNATTASFNQPNGVAVDAGGNVYVADAINQRIRKVTSTGVVTTLAGNGTAGYADGGGSSAMFNIPCGIAIDAGGNLYVADGSNNRIRKVTPGGVVTTLAGSGSAGFADGTGSAAMFNNPGGVAVDASGVVYVGDSWTNRIRRMQTQIQNLTTGLNSVQGQAAVLSSNVTSLQTQTAGLSSNLTTLQGTTNALTQNLTQVDNGLASLISRFRVIGLSGNLSFGNLTVNSSMQRTLSITNTGFDRLIVSGVTLPSGFTGNWSGTILPNATQNITITFMPTASQSYQGQVVINSDSTFGNSTISCSGNGIPISRIIALSGNMSFGNVTIGNFANRTLSVSNSGTGNLTINGISYPSGYSGNWSGIVPPGSTQNITVTFAPIAISSYSGNINVSSDSTQGINTILASGNGIDTTVTTFAGSGVSTFANGNGTSASFTSPSGLVFDSSGNLFVADPWSLRIRRISPSGVVSTFAGSGNFGYADGIGTAAVFNIPHSIAIDGSGNFYVSERDNNRIRKITANATVTTLAGSGSAAFADGNGTSASFNQPYGMAVDSFGNVYVADTNNNRIRKITPSGNVTTFAGSGTAGFADGSGVSANFSAPGGLAIDQSGNLYVADTGNHRIRKISSSGVVTTFAGSGSLGSLDATGTAASFNQPLGLAIDNFGNLYVGDWNSNKVRQINPNGVVITIAGSGTLGYLDGLGRNSNFNHPAGIAVDTNGNVFVADFNNYRIRKISK